MPIAELNGARIHYLQVPCEQPGPCPDLLLIHGLAANLATWYLHTVPVFSRRFRLTLLDLRGHGRSSVTPDGYSAANMAEDVRQLLDSLGIRQTHVLAHSFGGAVALAFACAQPQRVASLVLADAQVHAVRASGCHWRYAEEIQRILDDNGIDLKADEPYFGYRLLREVAQPQWQEREFSPALRELIAPMVGRSGRRTAEQWARLLEQTSAQAELMGDDGLSPARLQTLAMPILALYGERSYALASGEFLAGLWPQADFRVIAGAGHFFPSSRPQELIQAAERFWEQTTALPVRAAA